MCFPSLAQAPQVSKRKRSKQIMARHILFAVVMFVANCVIAADSRPKRTWSLSSPITRARGRWVVMATPIFARRISIGWRARGFASRGH